MVKNAILYKGKFIEKNVVFTRVWAMPSPWTFSIRPIRELVIHYVKDGIGWADPFAGKFSPAEITNDHNPDRNAKYHMEAMVFCKWLSPGLNGVLFDPPYSFRQISEHYKLLGMKASQKDTSMCFYEKPKSILAEKVKKGGIVICCGWNTNGFGRARGYKIIEIMAVAHGGSKNDTLITVEKKL